MNILENIKGRVNHIDLVPSSNDEPMVIFKTEKEEVKQIITQGFQIDLVTEALKGLYPNQRNIIKFENYKQFNSLLDELQATL